jgi:uncharacterized protein (DUF1330 family)
VASYLLAEIEVLDRTKYTAYIELARPIVLRHGGEYVLRSEEIVPVSGGWCPERVLLIRFPDREAIAACFTSAEYQAIKHLREESTRSRSIIVDQ